ncbi:hypothetical protein [Streptomyces sp. NPDC060194]|uniref:hypothetical protein n=1 Tax=Streptomyces sp. NPDC060194 TaxID=3347069 RepID=UPI00365EF63E
MNPTDQPTPQPTLSQPDEALRQARIRSFSARMDAAGPDEYPAFLAEFVELTTGGAQ